MNELQLRVMLITRKKNAIMLSYNNTDLFLDKRANDTQTQLR